MYRVLSKRAEGTSIVVTDDCYRVGIDIGGTKIAGGVVSPDGTLLTRERVPTPRTGGNDVMAAACSLTQRLIDNVAPQQVSTIGVGAPGVLDYDTGRVCSATEVLPGWARTDVPGPLIRATGLPVAVDNDVRVAALGEALFGAGMGVRRLLVVSLGTGVGAGFVFDGELQRGGNGAAGEVAHLRVGDIGSIACGCGRFDHLESHCCGPALAAAYARVRSTDGARIRLEEVVDRWSAGDAIASRVMLTGARIAGQTLAGLASAVDIDAMVVTGGVAGIGEPFLGPLRDAFTESVIGPLKHIPVLAGPLGTDAPLLGAAALADTAGSTLFGTSSDQTADSAPDGGPTEAAGPPGSNEPSGSAGTRTAGPRAASSVSTP